MGSPRGIPTKAYNSRYNNDCNRNIRLYMVVKESFQI